MYFIGLDIGNTGVKALVTDEGGSVVSHGQKNYRANINKEGIAVRNPEDWWICTVGAVREAISEFDSGKVAAIGLSAQGGSMTAVDKYGNPVIEVINRTDVRAKEESEELDLIIGTQRMYRKCGWRITPSNDAAKILWIKRNRTDVANKAEFYLSALDFINLRLVGSAIIDPTCAAVRTLYNIQTNDWDDEIINALGISRKSLPRILPSGFCLGGMTKYAAAALGLNRSVKVYNGALDRYCSSIGSGTVNVGDIMLTTGTEWDLLGIADSLIFTPSYLSTGICPFGYYGAMVSVIPAGSVMRRFSQLAGEDYSDIDAEAQKKARSASELLFIPYNTCKEQHGSNAALGGTVFGLTAEHDRFDLARALMESTAFETKLALEEFSKCGIKAKRMVMIGDASRSNVWRQIISEVLGVEMYVCEQTEICALGAAMTAAVGHGAYTDMKAAMPYFVKRKRIDDASGKMTEFYMKKYRRYREKIKTV